MHQKKGAVKHCPKCDITKDASSFGRDASRPDGRYTYCKTCRLRPKSRAEMELEELAAKQLKRCTKCSKVKPFNAFDSDTSKRFGRASSCKKCHRERKRIKTTEWRATQEELSYLHKRGKSRCTRCDSIKPISNFLKAKKTKLGIYRLCKDCNNSYRSRRKPSMRDYTNWEVFEDDEFTCYLCEEILDPSAKHPDPKCLTIDHVFPISLGGADARENVRTACLECNLDKRATPLEQYLELKGASEPEAC